MINEAQQHFLISRPSWVREEEDRVMRIVVVDYGEDLTSAWSKELKAACMYPAALKCVWAT